MKNYYDILGVSKTANKDELKKAFHKLAHKYHPDKKDGDEAKFKEVNEAYQVLSDDQKRAQYDQFGSYNPNQGGGQANWGGFDFSGFGGQGGGMEFDLGDIFGDIFGSGRSGGRTKRGNDISVDLQISFSEAIFGVERKVLITKVDTCQKCSGNGAEPGTKTKKCENCKGTGKIHETKRSFLGTFATTRECEKCHGRGEIPEKACHACGGRGVLRQSEEIKIAVPAGIQNGEMLRMSGRGEAVPGGIAGDLYIKIHVDKHKVFTRDGANILMDLPVKLTDALLGADYPIETLDGQITVKIPAGISSGEFLRVRDKGVPISNNKRGDLLIKVIVKTPTKLSKRAKELIDGLKKEGM